VLALKANQGMLREDVERFAQSHKAQDFADAKGTQHQSVEGDHGRIETRTITVFHDDECRVRTAHAPAKFTTLKRMALNLLRRARDKLSVRARRKAAAWDDDFLVGLLAG